MGYYHVELHPESKKLCTLIFPWGKYEMQCLPMGLCNGPDVFQEKMSTLFADLEYVRTYIDDLLVITKGDLNDHLEKLDIVLNKLKQAGLKINANKSFFCQHELEYLGYWLTCDSIKPLPNKVRAIEAISTPTNKKELRSFIGMVNYYRNSWFRRSDLLAPLTKLTGKTSIWQWTDVHQKAFDDIKKVISREVLLTYPNFNKPFEIHTDASDYQLGSVVSQDNKPIAFFSRKLNKAQRNYTVTKKELLAILETLKEFRNILLGQDITIFTDHKNLTYKVFNTERVMRWRLICKEFGPKLVYLKRNKNIIADAISRMKLKPTPKSLSNDSVLEVPDTRELAEAFVIEDECLPEWTIPISYKLLFKNQQKDKDLKRRYLKNSNDYKIRSYSADANTVRKLITYKDHICVPQSLQKRMVEWYHEMLCHPGEVRTEATIAQHFYWKGLRSTVKAICSKCDVCQRTKKVHLKYGKLPPKTAETKPWQVLCVDLIGPYNLTTRESMPLHIWAIMMIDPATGWLEIAPIDTKRADNIANVVEQVWLTRYPWPDQVTYDRGTEFMAEFTEMVTKDYNIKQKPITTRNPQSNAIVERVHQTLGNMLRTFEIPAYENAREQIPGILAAIAFGICSTIHTTTRATPMQLVFGCDSILNVQHLADWRYIQS